MKIIVITLVFAIFLFTPLGLKMEPGNMTAEFEETMVVQKDYLSTVWQTVNNELDDYKLVLITKLKNEHPYTDFVILYEDLGEMTRLLSPDSGHSGNRTVSIPDTVPSVVSDSITIQAQPVIVDMH